MTIKMVQNDTRPILEFAITQDGSPLDLTGCTVKFYMKNSSTGVVKVNGNSCSIVSATAGTCRYIWSSTDTDTAGSYLGEIEITFPDAKKQTGYKLFTIVIRDDI